MTTLLNHWALNAYYLAAGLYLAAALAARRPILGGWLLGLGLAANLASVAIKLYGSWPMQAPYQEPFWLSLCLAGLAFGLRLTGKKDLSRAVVFLTAGLAGYAALFPKSDYLPFPRSATVFAHIHLLFSALGKSFFWAAGLEAVLFLRARTASPGRPRLFGRLAAWGFIIYSLGLFSADVWSYLGWTSPVVWREYVMTAIMAVWFYYGAFLHLYLLRAWPLRRRAWFAATGMALLFYFSFLPETGQFQVPRFLL